MFRCRSNKGLYRVRPSYSAHPNHPTHAYHTTVSDLTCASCPDWPRPPQPACRQPFTLDDHSKVVPRLPIPNRTVKRLCADDSWHSPVKVGHRQALTPQSPRISTDAGALLFVNSHKRLSQAPNGCNPSSRLPPPRLSAAASRRARLRT